MKNLHHAEGSRSRKEEEKMILSNVSTMENMTRC
jgi:hypothetical protein